MRLRIVYRGYFPAKAGAELMAQRLAVSMSERGHRVTVHTTRMDPEAARWLAGAGVSIKDLPAHATGEPPDLVHTVDAVTAGYPRAALRLAREWGVPFAYTPASAWQVWSDPAAILDVCRQADALFVLTDAERAMLLEAGVPAAAMHTIGMGPHLTADPRPERFRTAYRIDGPMVLFLGRKMRSKGYALLLEAAARVWETHPRARFVFAGPRWDPDAGEVFARHADPRILELGMVDETAKADALAACDVFCLPSVVDIFPLVFVEAWTSGKPVVASTFAGSDAVIRDGVDGLVVPSDAAAVAAAVTTLLSDPVRAAVLGEAGRERARRDLGWAAVNDRIEAVYAALTADPAMEEVS